VANEPSLKATLKRWFAEQSEFKDLREMAAAIGIPFNTLRGYFSGKTPSQKNLLNLSGSTGLDLSAPEERGERDKPRRPKSNHKQLIYALSVLEEFQAQVGRCLTSVAPAEEALRQQIHGLGTAPARNAKGVQVLMDALQRSIEPFLDDPASLRVLRQGISGSDAGYLSGLLAAIFDDRRLQTWRQLTTYKYGSK